MKKILISLLLAGTLFCVAAPINNNDNPGGKTKPAKSAVSTKKPEADTKPKATKTKKVKKEVDHTIWNNNNGGGRTTYH